MPNNLCDNNELSHNFCTFFFQMRFLDCREGRKDPSKSILDVGVKQAISFSGFDEKMFLKRGGKYVWSKADMKLDWWNVTTQPLLSIFITCNPTDIQLKNIFHLSVPTVCVIYCIVPSPTHGFPYLCLKSYFFILHSTW